MGPVAQHEGGEATKRFRKVCEQRLGAIFLVHCTQNNQAPSSKKIIVSFWGAKRLYKVPSAAP